MNLLQSTDPDFKETLTSHLHFESNEKTEIENIVSEICNDIKLVGDRAVLKYTERFDHVKVSSIEDLILDSKDLQHAFESLPKNIQKALKDASDRILDYHQRQKQSSWQYQDDLGNTLGQKITPIERVGIYVPGGKAAYPSSVLMNAIPAKVAGVKDITMVVPTPNNERNQAVLAAAYLAGVTKIITIGGAQAIAALAYGTESILAVDKITGPGNAYVAAAKKQVYGIVGIDMIAGPSEILIISDGSTNPDWIALDLFSQAEHDELAQSILISPDAQHIKEVKKSINKLLAAQPRQKIIEQSLKHRGIIIHSQNLDEACEIANYISPEHLELSLLEPEQWIEKIQNAGAIFLGKNTTESFGDYCAGPNHVLPTSRSARFASPLGVYDFQKKTSIIKIETSAVDEIANISSSLAKEEGLFAHAAAAEIRMNKK